MRSRPLLALGALLAAACGPPPEPGAPMTRMDDDLGRPTPEQVQRAAARFETMEAAFLDWYHEAYPVRATALGLHGHDTQLPAHDRAAIQRRIDDLLDWLRQIEAVPGDLLEDDRRLDRRVLEFAVRSELLSLEEIRPWANDPRHYTGLIADGVASIADRQDAPAAELRAALASRMGQALGLLEAARANLRSPPRLWTELAIVESRALIAYLRHDLPAALSHRGGGTSGAEHPDEAMAELVAALETHASWLERDLLPRSTGDYRLGEHLFQRKLLYDEHVNLGVGKLERLNERKIDEYHEWVARVAAGIDPARPPREIMDSLARIHPSPEELLPTARATMLDARDWVRQSGLVTLPTEEVPEVVEAPSYPTGEIAWLEAPGPLAERELGAYYRIRSLEASWTEERRRHHLAKFNGPELLGVTVHETFPGRFVQLAHARRVESRTRKTFLPRSLTEGWPHYAEQMVLDEGFREGDPAARLGQLRRALQRHARWHAALQLHAFGATVNEVVPRFMEIAYLDEASARREVVRASWDPTYLHEALGRIQILDLRDAYRESVEDRKQEFSLREFHDRLLGLGLPLSLASEALLNAPRGPRLEPLGPRRR